MRLFLDFNKISSDFIFVSPYGELGLPKGIDSLTSKFFGVPYTVQDEENINKINKINVNRRIYIYYQK